MKILFITFSILIIFLTKLSLSQNCNLYDSRTGNYYDFTPLSTKSYSYDIDNRLYLFSICNTSPYCFQNGQNVSACYMSSDGNINTIGLINEFKINTLDYKEGGSIEYKFSSDFCQHEYLRTRIELICDDSNTSIDKIEEDSLCSYNIIMRSPLACPIKKPQSSKAVTNDTINCINGDYNYIDKACLCKSGFTGIDCSVAYKEVIEGSVQYNRGYPTVYFSGYSTSWTLTAYTLDEIDPNNQMNRSIKFNEFYTISDSTNKYNWTGNFFGITVTFNISESMYYYSQNFSGYYLPSNKGSLLLTANIKGYSMMSPTNKLVLNFKVDAGSNVLNSSDNKILLGKPNSLYYAQNFKNLFYYKENSYDIGPCIFSSDQLYDTVNLNYTFTVPNGVKEVTLGTVQSAYVISTSTPPPTPSTGNENVTFVYTTVNYTIGEEAIIETNTKRYSSLSLTSMINTVTSTNKFRTSTITTISFIRSDGSTEVTVSTTIVDNTKVTATLVKPSSEVNNAMKMNNISKSFITSIVAFIILYLI